MATDAFTHALLAGRGHFAEGRYFAAHEAWEEGFHLTRGGERLTLQALILWAAALHHHGRGNPEGARRLTQRALERVGRAGVMVAVRREPLEDALLTTLEAIRDGTTVDPSALLAPAVEEDGAPPEAPPTVELRHLQRCPWCGEEVVVEVAPEDAVEARFVEDCPVCCRPWDVVLHHAVMELRRAS